MSRLSLLGNLAGWRDPGTDQEGPPPSATAAKPAPNAAPRHTGTSPAGASVKGDASFEVVSVTRTNAVKSYPNSIYWKESQDSNGLVVIVKQKTAVPTVIYSTDFSLSFPDDNTTIPRCPTIGLSDGMKSATGTPSWILGRGVTHRFTHKEGDRYFALLFEGPKKFHEFASYYAVPIGKNLKENAK